MDKGDVYIPVSRLESVAMKRPEYEPFKGKPGPNVEKSVEAEKK